MRKKELLIIGFINGMEKGAKKNIKKDVKGSPKKSIWDYGISDIKKMFDPLKKYKWQDMYKTLTTPFPGIKEIPYIGKYINPLSVMGTGAGALAIAALAKEKKKKKKKGYSYFGRRL